MTENEARQVLLLQAQDSAAGTPHWSAEDRAWATRQAAAAVGENGTPERFVVHRAALGLQRLLPRDAAARRWLERRAWHPALVWLGALLGFVVGVIADRLGPPEHVNLLAPAVWAVVVWNLLVYVGVLLPWPRRKGPRRAGSSLARWLTRWGQRGDVEASALWARQAAPLSLARAALVLHVAAAALALGLMAGLYLRGLVLDYRAGWQSTFLDAPTVQAGLNTLLMPASALTRIPVPDVVPLRVGPGAPAQASAAPWIHLYAATLALWVVLPRLLLALWSAWRARRFERRFPLSLDTPYFESLHPLMRPGVSRVLRLLWVAPAGMAPATLLGHRVADLSEPLTLLQSEEGDELVLVPEVAQRAVVTVAPAGPWWQRWLDGPTTVSAPTPDAVLLVLRPGDVHPAYIAELHRPVVLLHDAAVAEAPALPLRHLAEGWLADGRWLRALRAALEGDSRVQRLAATWRMRQQQHFDAAVAEMAASLAKVATSRVPLAKDGLIASNSVAEEAQRALHVHLQDEWRASAARLDALQGRQALEDLASADASAQGLPTSAALRKRVGEGSAAVVGGVTTGALAGLKADIATGGLTMGAGLVAGALIGAITAAGLARGVNVVRGTDRSYAVWDAQAMALLTEAWLLRELLLSGSGGRSEEQVRAALAPSLAAQQTAFTAAWKSRGARTDEAESERLAVALKPPLAAVWRDTLERLHPVAFTRPPAA